MQIIDIHSHVTTKNINKDIENILKDMKENNVRYSFLMASYFPKNHSGVSNYRLYYHIKNIEALKMWTSLDFENYFWMGYNEINELMTLDPNKIVGIKIYTGYQNIDTNSDNFKMILDLARKHNKPIMFHTGYMNHQEQIYSGLYLEKVIANNQDINFIFAHLNNPLIDDISSMLNTYENLYTDISGLVESKDYEIDIQSAIKCLDKLFINKVDHTKILFGSDWPVQSIIQTKEIINNTVYRDNKEEIYYKNTIRLFNIN